MSELTDFTNPEPDLTTEEKELLLEAGASNLLIKVCDYDISNCPRRRDGKRVQKNGALREVKKYLREWEALTEDKVGEFSHYGGGYFAQLWDGDLYKAYSRADYNNKAILREVFGVKRINQYKPPHATEVTP